MKGVYFLRTAESSSLKISYVKNRFDKFTWVDEKQEGSTSNGGTT